MWGMSTASRKRRKQRRIVRRISEHFVDVIFSESASEFNERIGFNLIEGTGYMNPFYVDGGTFIQEPFTYSNVSPRATKA